MTQRIPNPSLTRRRLLAASAATAAAGLAAPAFATTTPLSIVATTGMIADTVARVGGDAVTVTSLMGPGVDPHAYRQTRSDIVAMTRADLVLWNGLYLEAQLEELFADLGTRMLVRAVAEAVPQDLLVAHDDYPDRFDPHVWMDPVLWSHATRAMAAALTELRPDAATQVAETEAAFAAELDTLAAYAREVLGSVPESARVLLTAHDAFNYFGRAYGFEVVGIQGISTESEAGLNRIGALVDMLVTRDVRAVFVETSVSDRNIRALIEGAAARGHEVRIGGELFSDAMGPAGTYEGTYPGMIDHNATVIARALGGTAPARGMSGLLLAEAA